jgi:prepilin-type N-terminal cleavage/methylation domain-containing protein
MVFRWIFGEKESFRVFLRLGDGLAPVLLKRTTVLVKQKPKERRSAMISKIRNSKAAFTLVEIMIVVAIIGLLAALAIPGFVKARKQSQGRRIINDARQIDAAIDQWALEKGKKDNDAIDATAKTEIATYLKTGTFPTKDVLNNDWAIGAVGSNQVGIAAATKTALDGVGIDWGTF